MPSLIFYKPYGVLSHFTGEEGQATLAAYIHTPGVYAAGRLDMDSEGLLILSDDGKLIQRIIAPDYKHPKTYWVQVEGNITADHLQQLRRKRVLSDQTMLPVSVAAIDPPPLPERAVRAYHPTPWMQIIIAEGKKHQVRRMTAAVGLPALRLVRWAIGSLTLEGLQPGEWRWLDQSEIAALYGDGFGPRIEAKDPPHQPARRPKSRPSKPRR